ncbi:symmetrical bis(5'-nucleosyl)-tetraphosphatase [Rhodoferax aquaticus]|uniref:bis(5'-nucleosyl)-tetraphosphatase (symmetrical) n=1 Tax=Rhodoferax aquaticus TaxID=2527691 RepID=A0A515EMH0_9BURK|nr:symmetrical bis(5'-nucleosyl)-tetraphosphatase [Rhodoferax aquaticus]QDL53848.1 symmetrical bis(5'-nucleosyl)-tetraphosphatase [Rhodoferax aquaticus]
MALYLIGDVQGCNTALQGLLDTVAFSPSRDTLYLLGDLVNRGPDSAGVLRRLMGYGVSAQCLLGNHDLHLLAVSYGVRPAHRKDTLDGILHAPDRAPMLEWLRQQHLALELAWGKKTLLMVHAGVQPAWSAAKTIALAAEVETILRSPEAGEFFHAMYGNQPDVWSDALTGMDRSRLIVNTLTRMRFCTASGQMDFKTTDGADSAPAGYMPWFDAPNRQTAQDIVAFGHWSTLGLLARKDVYALDTGCVWGGCLSALKLETPEAAPSLVQQRCEQAQKPG